MNNEDALEIPVQTIPAPSSISPQGQAYLRAAAVRLNPAFQQGACDAQAALANIRQMADSAVTMLRTLAARFKGDVETIPLSSGAHLYRIIPQGRSGRLSEACYFDIHGGGFATGGGEMCLLLAKLRAMEYGVEVFTTDYRLLPDHPFPAAFNDCTESYRKILSLVEAKNIVVGGSSAGGNLAAATLLYAQNEALPLPKALMLLTPALDLTLAGDSFKTNYYLDVNLYGTVDILKSYATESEARNPYVSPLLGEISSAWPTTLLMSGTRDLLLSDTVRMHRKLRRAGINAELHISEAGPHGGFIGSGAPEDADVMAECRRFTANAWGITPREGY